MWPASSIENSTDPVRFVGGSETVRGIIGRFYTSQKAWRNVFIPILAVASLFVGVVWLWRACTNPCRTPHPLSDDLGLRSDVWRPGGREVIGADVAEAVRPGFRSSDRHLVSFQSSAGQVD